ncbi:MAG TPA: TIGR01548 family HAD-type hydrolase [Allocoleopsis sp.]
MTTSKSISSPLAIVVFDIDGVIRDVTGSHFRAVSDTVKYFTEGSFYPNQEEIDHLLSEGIWNNDYQLSQELVYRYYESQGKPRDKVVLDFQLLVNVFEHIYWGDESSNTPGYIHEEKLLVTPSYFDHITQAGILWGFFTGATRLSAEYVLENCLGLKSPFLFTIEDGPGKPEPIGLFTVVKQLEISHQMERSLPVIFAGDTVTEQETINRARKIDPTRKWIGIGILPPHIQKSDTQTKTYTRDLVQSGAQEVILSIEHLTAEKITFLIQ